MRENRPYGSEGGEAKSLPYPYRRDVEHHPMDARDVIKIGMSAERTLIVPSERTVGHFLPGMPMVYATPMMILEMEMTSGDAINGYLEPGWVTVGTEVDIRHLAASPVRTLGPTGDAPGDPVRGRGFRRHAPRRRWSSKASTSNRITRRSTAITRAVERRVIRFEVEAFDDQRRLGACRRKPRPRTGSPGASPVGPKVRTGDAAR